MQKQSFNRIILFISHFSLILLMLNLFLACNDKQKNDITTDDSDDESVPQSYVLSDYHAGKYPVSLKKRTLHFENIEASLVIVHLFKPKKNIAPAQIKMLTKIQKQFKTNIAIKHIPVGNTNNPENRDFFNQLQEHLLLQESNILPLLILYKDHRYYTHFEGKIPIEMLRHTIQNILKK